MTMLPTLEPASHSFRAMNTGCRLITYPALGTSEVTTQAALHEAEAMVRAIEARFSRFRDSSELCHINSRGGEWVVVSSELVEVIGLATELHHETNGVFDPAIIDHLEFAGYGASFEKIPAEGPPLGGLAPRHHRFAEIEFAGANRLRLPMGLRLDLGGIVKGWAADRIVEWLQGLGPTLVDLGGDIAVRGVPPDEPGWLIGVEKIDCSGELLTMLQIEAGGVATSGTSRRRWKRGRRWMHHLIDPRDGKPAQTDLRQVTAIDQSAARAEAWAKTALIIGSAGCERLLRDRPELGLLLVANDGTATATPRVLQRLANGAVEDSGSTKGW